MARWGGPSQDVEHLVLSDSVLLLESPEGGVRAILDDRIDRLPRELLRTHESADRLRNAEGGFFTAAADPGVTVHAVAGRTPRERVRALAALTDGASRWVEMFEEGSWTQCLGVLRKEGAQGLIDRVRAVETAALERTTVIRWKLHDDAAVVFAEL